MRLSEAIRLGAMLRPQTRGAMYERRWQFGAFRFGALGSCALGAACEAKGIVVADAKYVPNEALRVYPILNVSVPCPECVTGRKLFRMIAHLNDAHRWTRERIADWVATVEPVEIAPPVVAETFTASDAVPTR